MTRVIRGLAFFAVSFLLTGFVVISFVHAQTIQVIDNEHRLTALETKVDAILADVHDLRQYNWVALLGIAGLSGEAGLRLFKKPGEKK